MGTVILFPVKHWEPEPESLSAITTDAAGRKSLSSCGERLVKAAQAMIGPHVSGSIKAYLLGEVPFVPRILVSDNEWQLVEEIARQTSIRIRRA